MQITRLDTLLVNNCPFKNIEVQTQIYRVIWIKQNNLLKLE